MAGTRTGSSPYIHAGPQGVFVDGFGNTQELHADHRSLIKPEEQRELARDEYNLRLVEATSPKGLNGTIALKAGAVINALWTVRCTRQRA